MAFAIVAAIGVMVGGSILIAKLVWGEAERCLPVSIDASTGIGLNFVWLMLSGVLLVATVVWAVMFASSSDGRILVISTAVFLALFGGMLLAGYAYGAHQCNTDYGRSQLL